MTISFLYFMLNVVQDKLSCDSCTFMMQKIVHAHAIYEFVECPPVCNLALNFCNALH